MSGYYTRGAAGVAALEQVERRHEVVERETFVYRHRVPRSRYVQMVRDQYMSVLSTFSQAEIEAGVAEIEERYRDRDVLEYDDRFDCITGRKAS